MFLNIPFCVFKHIKYFFYLKMMLLIWLMKQTKQTKAMKTKEITIKVKQFENGNIILDHSNRLYYVKTSDGVMAYNRAEMKEIYNYKNK